jgi:DNA-binding NarL/FixJ family response regulator
MIVVQVSDNGAGFDIEQARRDTSNRRAHFGLRSMQERVEQAGGTFTLTSNAGEGTTVKASFPLPLRTVALTNREREVLELLVEGASNRAIAERLSVSVETVKSHMHHILQKLGTKDRTQAAVLAARQQWV